MEVERIRFTASNVIQKKVKFYSLTMPAKILTQCCFVTTRDESPVDGFQRVLDKRRAQEIAEYIDSDQGTIPSAVILSAQKEAELSIVGRGRTLEFSPHPKAFLILDGQHRVYGFSLSQADLRVPVIIYNNLTRKEESRLFIDINSKQKGVPTELLLDIKKMADYESNTEEMLRSIFDLFHSEPKSSLYGRLSASAKARKKLTRVSFNAALNPVSKVFAGREANEMFEILNCYLTAFIKGYLAPNDLKEQIAVPVIFKAIIAIFPEVSGKVKDKFGPDFSVDNYNTILSPIFEKVSVNKIKKPGASYKALAKHFSKSLTSDFSF